MDQAEFRRLAWHCRRGMLENDLVLQEFMQRYGNGLEGTILESFRRLLEFSDGDLWDLISGRRDTVDPELVEIVGMLRDCTVRSE